MITLAQLAQDAAYAVSDLIEDDAWGAFEALTDSEKVEWRYCFADCDDFAYTLSEITGWPAVGVVNPSRGPIHRLVEAPDGRLLDAKGWVSLDDLRVRYRLKSLRLIHGAGVCSPLILDDADFHPHVSAILQLPRDPFRTASFQQMANAFARRVGLDVPSKPRRAACQRPR